MLNKARGLYDMCKSDIVMEAVCALYLVFLWGDLDTHSLDLRPVEDPNQRTV